MEAVIEEHRPDYRYGLMLLTVTLIAVLCWWAGWQIAVAGMPCPTPPAAAVTTTDSVNPHVPSMSKPGLRGCHPKRDARGRIVRSPEEVRRFLASIHLTRTPRCCQVDHIVPLTCGGCDNADENMQLTCGDAMRAKERVEQHCAFYASSPSIMKRRPKGLKIRNLTLNAVSWAGVKVGSPYHDGREHFSIYRENRTALPYQPSDIDEHWHGRGRSATPPPADFRMPYVYDAPWNAVSYTSHSTMAGTLQMIQRPPLETIGPIEVTPEEAVAITALIMLVKQAEEAHR